MKKITVFLLVLANLMICCACAEFSTVNSDSKPEGTAVYAPESAVTVETGEAVDSVISTVGGDETTTDVTDVTDVKQSAQPVWREIVMPTEIKDLTDWFDCMAFGFSISDNHTQADSEKLEQLRSICQQRGTFMRLVDESDGFNTPLDQLTLIPLQGLEYYIPVRSSHFKEKRTNLETNGRKPGIEEIYQFYPIERIEKIDSDSVCLIFRTELEGRTVYAYKVFSVYNNKNIEEYEDIRSYSEYYYITKVFSKDELMALKPGDVLSKDMLLDLTMLSVHDNCWYNDVCVSNEIYKAAIPVKEGLVILTTNLVDNDQTKRSVVETEFFPYGKSCEKYPLISILSDGYYPSIP